MQEWCVCSLARKHCRGKSAREEGIREVLRSIRFVSWDTCGGLSKSLNILISSYLEKIGFSLIEKGGRDMKRRKARINCVVGLEVLM